MSERQKREVIAEFEMMGEDQVRLKLPHYKGLMRDLAIGWLAQFDESARLRNETSQSESLAIAKSAKDAAWEAARAAKNANNIAVMAMIAALIAIAVSIVGIFVKNG